MEEIHNVIIDMSKARNGWTVHVQPQDMWENDICDEEGNPIGETFILAGDLDAEQLGKEIVASFVSLRIGEQPTKKRR